MAERSRRGHVTATDNADAEMLLDVVEALWDHLESDETKAVARNTIARFLADKREEWIEVAMLRVERTFKVKRIAEVRGTGTGTKGLKK